MTDDTIIAQTVAWIKSVVIGCHFCPFAAKAMLRESIRYVVLSDANSEDALTTLIQEMKTLEQDDEIETTLIILPFRFDDFRNYLDLVSKAEATVTKQQYDGVFQIASFHPEYCFAGSNNDDPANYTNRSIYPMLHILREESISQAIEHYPGTEYIPEQNIAFTQQKGLAYMQLLRAACLKTS